MPGKKKRDTLDPRPLPENMIRRWRTYRDLTLEELAERSGLSVSTIAEVEKRETDFTGKTLLQLAVALGTDPGSLLSRDPVAAGDEIWSIWQQLGEKGMHDTARSVLSAINQEHTK